MKAKAALLNETKRILLALRRTSIIPDSHNNPRREEKQIRVPFTSDKTKAQGSA